MDVNVDKTNNDKIIFNCTPKETSKALILNTKNKAVTKNLEINYNIPNTSSSFSYSKHYTINPSLSAEKKFSSWYSLGYYQFNTSAYPSSTTFAASSNLSNYLWYNQSYNISHTVNSYTRTYKFKPYSGTSIYTSDFGATEYISSGSTRTESTNYDYRGLEIWVSYGSTFEYYAKVPNVSKTFQVNVESSGTAGYVRKVTTLGYGTSTSGSGFTAIGGGIVTSKYNGTPETPSFYVKIEMNVIDSDDIDNYENVYILPQLTNDMSDLRPWLKMWNSNPEYYADWNLVPVQNTCLVFYYDSTNGWRYYNPKTLDSGSMTRWAIRWDKSLSYWCPYLIKMGIDLNLV